MNKCYEFYLLELTGRDATDGRITSSELVTEIDSDTCDILDKILQKYERNSWEFFRNTDITLRKNGVWPWAIVFFKEEFQLSGHAVSIRENRRDFSFTSYSMKPWLKEEIAVPPLSVIMVFSKQSLKTASIKSELFNKAWEQLSDCSEEKHWICIAESPSQEWISQTSMNDNNLFIQKVCV
jgi:hypothetical protein